MNDPIEGYEFRCRCQCGHLEQICSSFFTLLFLKRVQEFTETELYGTNLLYADKRLLVQLHNEVIEKCHFLFLVVPLGSIQELPAESCSEIKASEGNEMVNGDYWIYSGGNGQTILARCEGAEF